MRREIKIERARKLRAEDPKRWTYAALAERYELGVTALYRALNPNAAKARREYDARYRDENREKRRAWQRQYDRRTTECPQCGGPMRPGPSCCVECRADELDRRARQIEKWWAEGFAIWEIAEELGWTENHAGVEVIRLREKGYSLPYRYTRGKRRGRKHPEQVAA